ncbi:Uncharacterized protein APZ42_009946 [Daphnia magna]|uniref:Uncharacterized protein n=1 Tax=Daphnia magna TaxID=35525 RepID=A0A162CXY3_9CRUS|nr:Uncharacterized protein APZ42_009946 [Daphnia magna]
MNGLGSGENSDVARNGLRTKSFRVFLVPGSGFVSAVRSTRVVASHCAWKEAGAAFLQAGRNSPQSF